MQKRRAKIAKAWVYLGLCIIGCLLMLILWALVMLPWWAWKSAGLLWTCWNHGMDGAGEWLDSGINTVRRAHSAN